MRTIRASLLLLAMLGLCGCVTQRMKPIVDWQRFAGLPDLETLPQAGETQIATASKKAVIVVLSKNVDRSMNQIQTCRGIVAETGMHDALLAMFGAVDAREAARTHSVADATVHGAASSLKEVFGKVEVAASLPEAIASAGTESLIAIYDLNVGESFCGEAPNGDTFQAYGTFEQLVQFLTPAMERLCLSEASTEFQAKFSFSQRNIEQSFVEKVTRDFRASLERCLQR